MSHFTIEEQLELVEAMVESLRWARGQQIPSERDYRVLKQIAADLRGRLPGAASEARESLERRFRDLDAVRAMLGAEVGVMQELTARWPVIRQALERFDEDAIAEQNMPSKTDLPF